MTENQDEHIKCSWGQKGAEPCGTPFVWTAKDQKFYAEKGYSKPKYCRPHREERKRQQQGPFGDALRKTRAQAHANGPRIPGQESDAEQFGSN